MRSQECHIQIQLHTAAARGDIQSGAHQPAIMADPNRGALRTTALKTSERAAKRLLRSFRLSCGGAGRPRVVALGRGRLSA